MDLELDELLLMFASSPQDAGAILEEIVCIPELIAAQDIIENSTRQREQGIYYTSFELAQIMIAEALEDCVDGGGTFLEPCVGGGAFYFSFIEQAMAKNSGSQADLQKVLDRSFIADNDGVALENLKKIAPAYFQARYGYGLQIPQANIFHGDSLWDQTRGMVTDFRTIFNQPNGFDFVITNPPYKLIKRDKRRGHSRADALFGVVNQISASKQLQFVQGVPNLYKLFVELIICKWVSHQGTVGLLIPRSLLSDIQSSDLRKHLLENFMVGSIFNIPEGSGHFKGVGQAFSMFVAHKGKSTKQVVFADVPPMGSTVIERSEPLSLDKIRKYSSKLALHHVNAQQQGLLAHLANFTDIGSSPELVNLRGEFDLSLDTEFLSATQTPLKLIQGVNLGHYVFEPSSKFVRQDFLNRPKGIWTNRARISCQQISNMNQKRRMKWSLIPAGHVLGNSCNFIGLEPEALWSLTPDSIYYFLGILNSSMMNERFKLLSPNNHVSNGEINTLPVGDLNSPEVVKIIELSKKLTDNFEELMFLQLEAIVLEHFKIDAADSYWEHN